MLHYLKLFSNNCLKHIQCYDRKGTTPMNEQGKIRISIPLQSMLTISSDMVTFNLSRDELISRISKSLSSEPLDEFISQINKSLRPKSKISKLTDEEKINEWLKEQPTERYLLKLNSSAYEKLTQKSKENVRKKERMNANVPNIHEIKKTINNAIYLYTNKSLYEREKLLIPSNILDPINDAIENEKTLSLYLPSKNDQYEKEKLKTIFPYRFIEINELLYLAFFERSTPDANGNSLYSVHAVPMWEIAKYNREIRAESNNISQRVLDNHSNTTWKYHLAALSKDLKEKLLYAHPDFVDEEPKEITVEFTSEGLKLFKNLTYMRPAVKKKISDEEYVLFCPEAQAEKYLSFFEEQIVKIKKD